MQLLKSLYHSLNKISFPYMKNFLKLFANFVVLMILYLMVAYAFKYMLLASFIVVTIKYTWKRKWSDAVPIMNQTLMDSLLRFDRYCNQEYRTMLNTLFVKGNHYPFGHKDETISSALGKNQKRGTLSILGWILVIFLWILDFRVWFKGGHCVDSIDLRYNSEIDTV